MDFSRTYVKNHNSPRIRKRLAAQNRFIHSLIKTILILILIVLALSIAGAAYYVKSQIDKLPDISAVNISPSKNKTRIVDTDGRILATLSAGGTEREYVSLKKIPKDLQHAIVAVEDERFYEHNGADIRSNIRAIFTGLVNGGNFSQGASTITQQLLDITYFSTKTEDKGFVDRLDHKIQQEYLAVQLERVKSKDQILEKYLNTLNLGRNTLGVEAAAERYFNKDVSKLNLSECTVLAAIARNPTKYNPINHRKNNALRREKVLKTMLDQGYITRKSYQKAIDDDVYSRIASENYEDEEKSSYFEDALTEQVVGDLKRQLGLTETEAFMKLYTGGLKIYATQSKSIQNIVDKEVDRKANYPGGTKYSLSFSLTVEKENGTTKNYNEKTMLKYYRGRDKAYTLNYKSKEEAKKAYAAYRKQMTADGKVPEGGECINYMLEPQTAVTIIDQKTGEVRAVSGGRGDRENGRTLNRATDTVRQPGSTFDILSAYAPAIDAAGETLATVEDDAPMTYQNGQKLKNYDKRYRGFTTIRDAVTSSVNVVAVKTLTKIGTGLGYQYVKDFGISTLRDGDNNESLALGGLTRGVKNIELAAAYGTIANGGYYRRPVYYTTIEDSTGKVILDTTNDKGHRVLKQSTAWLLTSAMEDAINKGSGINASFDGMTLAGKSGMTTDNRDLLLAGYSPYYTCVVTGGCDDDSPQKDTSYTTKIWKSIMQQIHMDKSYKIFKRPAGIVSANICRKSGKLPEENVCNKDPRGSMVVKEYFTADTVPTETCDHHVKLDICKISGLPAGDFCPKSDIVKEVFITGGSPGTEDSKYMISADDMLRTCNIHTSRIPPASVHNSRKNSKS
ncbi:MAG: glycosyl transferase [Lachnospiraceae bacterium]|nr:MAG: glycosyl transferase [Lachnospiraceae bacterium]